MTYYKLASSSECGIYYDWCPIDLDLILRPYICNGHGYEIFK